MLKLIIAPPFQAFVNVSLHPSAGEAISREISQHEGSNEPERDFLLAGAAVYSAYKSADKSDRDDLLSVIVQSMLICAAAEGATEEELERLRARMWRSAHQFLITNADVVDNGKEVAELKRILKL